ncbi:MAG: hypothetical protein AABZ25_05425, partial [Nitrospirota bacterium]
MKIFNKMTLLRSSIYFLLIFLSSCMATPQIHIKSAGMSMEIEKSAFKVISAVCSPDGRYIAAGYQDGTVRVWDVFTGKMLRRINVDPDVARFVMATGGPLGVMTVNFSPDGKYLITGNVAGYVKIWDVETGKEYIDLESKIMLGAGVKGAAIIYDRKRIYALAKKGFWMPSAPITIRVWDLVSGKKIKDISISDTSYPLTSFFSADGKYVLIRTERAIKYLDIDSEKEVWSKDVEARVLNQAPAYVTSEIFRFNNVVALSSDKRYVLSGGKATLKLRDAMSGREIKSFEGHTAEIHSVAFSPDGKLAVSGSADGTVRVWDLESSKEIKKLESYSGEVRSVVISPNGRYVVSTQDASVRIWDISTGEEIASMVGFGESGWLIITSDGYYNASEKGAEYLSVIVGEQKYDMNLFYDVFYRPDIVAAKLRGEDIKDLVTITMQDAIKSPPPVVEISSLPSTTNDSKVKVCYQAKSTGGGIGEIRLFHNGKLIESDGYYKETAKTSEKMQLASLNSNKIYEDMRSVKIRSAGEISQIKSKAKGEQFEACKEVDAISGENEISITAFNKDNTVQGYMQTAKFTSAIKQEEPHLYILSIGIDQYKDNTINLKYAVKDSKDIEEKIFKQAETLYKPQNIHYELLTDNNATKANITGKINELSKLIKPTDSFILF